MSQKKDSYSNRMLNEQNIQKIKSLQSQIRQKTEKKAISFYCPISLVKQIKEYAETHKDSSGKNLTKSEVIERALSEMLFLNEKNN